MIKRGFTLVETLVAISIFLIVTTVVMTTIQQSLQANRQASEVEVATFLATEGIEAIRQIRDSNRLNYVTGRDFSANWLNNIDDDCINGAVCQVNINNSVDSRVSVCPSDECQAFNLTNNGYGYSSFNNPVATPFKREVTFDYNCATSDEVERNRIGVVSTVSWSEEDPNAVVTVKESLFNWEDQPDCS